MTELVKAQAALRVDFVPSIGLDVLSSMGLVCLVHEFEGLDEWLLETSTLLPPRLRHDLQLCMRFGQYSFPTVEALAAHVLRDLDNPAHYDIHALIEQIAALDEQTCSIMLLEILERAAERAEIALDQPVAQLVKDQEAFEEFLTHLAMPIDRADVISFVAEPLEWRNLLVSTLQRFWDRYYDEEASKQQPLRERNVQYHRAHGYNGSFPDVFTAVTGRLLPDAVRARLKDIEEVRFVPSQYIGPYLSFLYTGSIMTVVYNSRVTPVQGDVQGERTQSLYQPLAALADKTRLQIMSLLRGRELYAQEIVNRLEIHQSAVSRHLKLMEAAGVLLVRRDKGAKFYSINQSRLEQLSMLLRELASRGEMTNGHA